MNLLLPSPPEPAENEGFPTRSNVFVSKTRGATCTTDGFMHKTHRSGLDETKAVVIFTIILHHFTCMYLTHLKVPPTHPTAFNLHSTTTCLRAIGNI